MYICKHFILQELVSPIVFKAYPANLIWGMFDSAILKDLDQLREDWGSAITINNWHLGGQYSESGLRCNADAIVKSHPAPYLGGHNLAKGFDLKPVDPKRTKELHAFIIKNQKKYPAIRRMENIAKTPTWVHVDGIGTTQAPIIIF